MDTETTNATEVLASERLTSVLLRYPYKIGDSWTMPEEWGPDMRTYVQPVLREWVVPMLEPPMFNRTPPDYVAVGAAFVNGMKQHVPDIQDTYQRRADIGIWLTNHRYVVLQTFDGTYLVSQQEVTDLVDSGMSVFETRDLRSALNEIDAGVQRARNILDLYDAVDDPSFD